MKETKSRNVKSRKQRRSELVNKKKKHLTDSQIKQLLTASKQSRYPDRNYLIILMLYNHGFRVSELITTELDDINLDTGEIHVIRKKGSIDDTQRMSRDELHTLHRFLKKRDTKHPQLFVNERGLPFTRQAINYILETCGILAGLDEKVTPHMLRHSCGYQMGKKGADLLEIKKRLGHVSPTNTAIYVEIDKNTTRGYFD